MKILDRILIIIFNICLVIVGLWISIIPITKSESYYKMQFKINDVYEHPDENGEMTKTVFRFLNGQYQRALFTDEQLDEMITHIIDFLFNDKESFYLELDDVLVYNSAVGDYVVTDNVSIFGEEAVTHMDDVKNLFILFQIVSVIAFLMFLGILAYLLLRINRVRHILLEYTAIFYVLFITGFSVFFMVTFIQGIIEYQNRFDMAYYIDLCWRNVHYLFFPFQPDKVAGSFFNDILTEILTLDLFVTAVVLVILSLVVVQVIWLTFTLVMKVFGNKIAYRIKQKRYKNAITFEE